MRKLIVLLTLVVSALGCEEDGTPEDNLSSTLNATIQGEPNFVSLPGLIETGGSANTNGILRDFYIISIDALGRIFSVRIEGVFNGVGTYEIKDYGNETDIVLVGFVKDDESGSWCGGCLGSNDSVVGQIEITEIIDNQLFATFSLTANNNDDGSTKAISGAFEITLK